MTNRPKSVSVVQTMTESFNEHTVCATCHLDSLEDSLRNVNDIANRNAQISGLLSCHVTTGRDVTSYNVNTLLIYIPNKILI